MSNAAARKAGAMKSLVAVTELSHMCVSGPPADSLILHKSCLTLGLYLE
jgi:hypothetical protein